MCIFLHIWDLIGYSGDAQEMRLLPEARSDKPNLDQEVGAHMVRARCTRSAGPTVDTGDTAGSRATRV